MSVEKRSAAYVPARPTRSWISASSDIACASPPHPSPQLPGVALGEGLRASQRVLELTRHPRLTVAIYERIEVPGGLLQLGVGGL